MPELKGTINYKSMLDRNEEVQLKHLRELDLNNI